MRVSSIVRREPREAYERWCTENGHPPFAARRFASRLRELGVVNGCVRRGTKVLDGWKNVRLMTDTEKERRAAAQGRATAEAPERQGMFADDSIRSTSRVPDAEAVLA